MRIRLVREGGFAGISRSAVVDTETLDSNRAGELHRLVAAANLESLPAEPGKSRSRDRFRYHLTVEDGRTSREARFSEEDAPEPLRALLEALRRESDAGTPTA